MAAEYIRIQTDLEQLKKTRSELEEQLKSEFLSEDGEKLMRLYEEKEGLLQVINLMVCKSLEMTSELKPIQRLELRKLGISKKRCSGGN